jgi:methionine sulfoxide reductase catalytic subunit|tara:strand:- start:984 stop:1982 length:999 start_codon:yes stop_codon:yes gene_type:complete
MLIKPAIDIPSSEITSHSAYLNRRKFMQQSGVALAAMGLASTAGALETHAGTPPTFGPDWLNKQVLGAKETAFGKEEKLTPYRDVTSYNNFYEFGTGKDDPARNAGSLVTDPWSVTIGGACENQGTFNLEDILKSMPLEERIYRLRCVEAWSMVIPWIGFPLADLIKRFKPLSTAKYVEFTTLEAPKQMIGQRSRFSTIDWPYVEALRIDEAMNPLTLMAVGLYGEILPKQNGAPIRLVVPWKYGFKSIKSIVKIRFTETPPINTWQAIAPREYGFYANVNPEVSHPRWSQAKERRLPSGLFNTNRIETQMFNGYGDQVAHLYKGMDLRKHY